jgi:hypothetical protein
MHSLVLEVEIAPDGKACSSGGDSSVDSEDGIGEPDVGATADCSGITAEDWYSIVTSNSCQVYAPVERKTGAWRRISELANLPAEPCQTDCGVRFFFTIVTASLKMFYAL